MGGGAGMSMNIDDFLLVFWLHKFKMGGITYVTQHIKMFYQLSEHSILILSYRVKSQNISKYGHKVHFEISFFLILNAILTLYVA